MAELGKAEAISAETTLKMIILLNKRPKVEIEYKYKNGSDYNMYELDEQVWTVLKQFVLRGSTGAQNTPIQINAKGYGEIQVSTLNARIIASSIMDFNSVPA